MGAWVSVPASLRPVALLHSNGAAGSLTTVCTFNAENMVDAVDVVDAWGMEMPITKRQEPPLLSQQLLSVKLLGGQ